jgi:hypothetical protein
VNVRLNPGGEDLEIQGNVVCNDMDPGGKYRVGIKFDALSAEQEQKLIRMMYAVQGNWKVNEEVEEGFVESFTQLLISPVNTFLKLKRMIRTQPRLKVSLPCVLELNGHRMTADTREISSRGLSLVVPRGSLPLHAIFGLQIYYQDHPLVSGTAEAVWRRSSFNKDVVGIRWTEDHPDLYETLKSMNMKKGNSDTKGEEPHNRK